MKLNKTMQNTKQTPQITKKTQNHLLARPLFIDETETTYLMSLINETETCHTLVLPARLRPRFIAPWSNKLD